MSALGRLLQAVADSVSAQQSALAEINDTVDRATLLANQMLALAKVEQLRQQGDAPVSDWAAKVAGNWGLKPATGRAVAQWKTDDLTSWGVIKSHHYLGGVFALLTVIAAETKRAFDVPAGPAAQTLKQFIDDIITNPTGVCAW